MHLLTDFRSCGLCFCNPVFQTNKQIWSLRRSSIVLNVRATGVARNRTQDTFVIAFWSRGISVPNLMPVSSYKQTHTNNQIFNIIQKILLDSADWDLQETLCLLVQIYPWANRTNSSAFPGIDLGKRATY